MKKIGFIGIGVMGKSQAANLMKAGYELTVYSRTKEKARELLDAGAAWADTPAACSRGQDAVITMVGFPKDVEEVYFGENGVLEGAWPGTILIDMTTTSPSLSVRIYEEAKKRGIAALDAPVSGGDTGAKNGTLTIMVGGDRDAYDECTELFSAMGTTLNYMGGPGAGQHTKMANQIALSGCIATAAEAIAYSVKNGLDPKAVYDAIRGGAAGSWQLENNGAKMIAGNMDPGFYIMHFVKDMKIAKEEAEKVGLDMEVMDRVLSIYEQLEEEGRAKDGTQAVIHHYI